MRIAVPITRCSLLQIIIGITLTLPGCGFFDDDDLDAGDEESGETGDPPPPEGFRVFPKFMLTDVPAIVTIEPTGAGVVPEPCLLDDEPAGGYVCDTSTIPGATATIRVTRDGFETAVRESNIVNYQLIELDVHLAVEGGPPGTWSPCTAVGEFEDCAQLCATQTLTCAVTSCTTDQPEWPLATHETFADGECGQALESLASDCATPLPSSGSVASLRCCCAV